jgi:hypothetical protein
VRPTPPGRRVASSAAAAFGLGAAFLAPTLASWGAGSAAPPPSLEASLSATELTIGTPLKVSGRVAEGSAGQTGVPLALEVAGYPYRTFRTVARATSTTDGRFAFSGVRLDRDSRLRVANRTAGGASGPTLSVIVDPRVELHARTLGPGETRLSVWISHAASVDKTPLAASWYLAPRGAHALAMTALTAARAPRPDLTYAEIVVEPPARHFVYRVCLNAPWEASMGPHKAHTPCPGRFQPATRASGQEGETRGTPLPADPPDGALSSAASFLDSRAGATSFAVIDNKGSLSGTRVHEHFRSASVVKVMMLIAYLQRLAAGHRGVGPSDNALLYPMIHVSDNEAASAVLGIVGQGALERVARESGMADYAPGVGWWAYTQTSAADQARLMISLPRLIPPQFYAYARGLLANIEPSQSWGIPPVARPSWQVFYKTGALPSQGLFVEAARLERPGVTFAVAVFTDGDPSMAYGEQTIEGVASALLRRR